MKKITTLFVLILWVYSSSYAQDKVKYNEIINEAYGYYTSGDYLKAGQTYTKAFVAWEDKGSNADRYNAACSWALANQPDSAFYQLFRIAQKGNYTNVSHLLADNDLNSLHDTERWSSLVNLVRSNKEKAEANYDKPLVALLDSIYKEDQQYRQQVKEINEKYGWDSDEMRAHWKIINEKDSLNLMQVKIILDERGWLGKDIIGSQGNMTLFLVIQHADLEIQEHYLPIMREAVKNGNAAARNLALLEDRVALRKGGKQIYGSQVTQDKETGQAYVMPLIDPDNVDQRRAEVGLGTIQEYISMWGITWDVEDYKRKLPEYEAKQKQ